jgi:diacylglycerol kinase family enzyme/membrane-associated phospholipid phosphatase
MRLSARRSPFRRSGVRGAVAAALAAAADAPSVVIPDGLSALPEPAARTVEVTLRVLTNAANKGVLWFGVAAVGSLLGKRPRRAAVRGLLSLGAASLTANVLIKPFVSRGRPGLERTALAPGLGSAPRTSSFPSGHSASAGAFVTGATLEYPPAALVVGPIAAAVGYSRVHVGVHFRSDVIAGLALGAGIALLGRLLWPVRRWGPAHTAPASAPALPTGAGLTVIVNDASGGSGDAAATIASALPDARVVRWDAETDLDELIGTQPVALGVAGGDGTVAAVAAVAHRWALPLAVFPAGTLNHFAKELALKKNADTLRALVAGSAGGVDLATIDGLPFLNNASMGGYPQMVLRRDRISHRVGKWPATAWALWRTVIHGAPLDVQINDERLRVWLVFIGNGQYTPRGLAPSWREDLAGRVLDVQYVRADRPLARTRAVVLSLLGVVQLSSVFGTIQTTKLVLRSHSGPQPIAHDGEVERDVEGLDVVFADRRLTVYRLPD